MPAHLQRAALRNAGAHEIPSVIIPDDNAETTSARP